MERCSPHKGWQDLGPTTFTSVDLRKHSITDTEEKSRKKHEDLPEGMYEEVNDSGRGERDM